MKKADIPRHVNLSLYSMMRCRDLLVVFGDVFIDGWILTALLENKFNSFNCWAVSVADSPCRYRGSQSPPLASPPQNEAGNLSFGAWQDTPRACSNPALQPRRCSTSASVARPVVRLLEAHAGERHTKPFSGLLLRAGVSPCITRHTCSLRAHLLQA